MPSISIVPGVMRWKTIHIWKPDRRKTLSCGRSKRVEQAIRQAEARGFANAMQMMQVGLMPKADPTPRQTASQPQPDSMQAMEMDEESLNIAMGFIDSL